MTVYNKNNYVQNSYDILLTDHTGRQTFNRHLLHYIWTQDDRIEDFIPKINKDSDIRNLVDSFGRTLLHYAVQYNHLPISNTLFNAGCSIHAADNLGETPFLIGLRKKDGLMINMLALRTTEVYIDEDIGKYWLRTILGDEELAKYMPRLILAKVKVKSGDDTELANILIEEKCELCYVIHSGNTAVIKIMLDRGFSIEAKDKKGYTALHFAVRLRQPENVKLLLERGANINAQNNKNQIPINYPKTLYTTAKHQEILKILMDNGTQWSLLDDSNKMQIYNILCNGPKEAVEILLNSKVDFLARDTSQKTILHYIVKNRNPGVVELLISRNIDVNVKDDKGRTPLHIAAKEKNEIACKILLDKDADINMASETYIAVPLFYAMKGVEYSDDYKKCVELLLERGADAQFFNKGLTVFNVPQSQNFAELSGILIGHFALLESLGTEIIEPIREKIEGNDFYKTQYDFCKQRLDKIKKDSIYEGITLFHFLSESENKVVGYMHNKEIFSKIQTYNFKYHFNSYINKQFYKRVFNAIVLADLRQRAALALKKFIDFKISSNSVIVCEIIGYLNRQDLQIVTDILFD